MTQLKIVANVDYHTVRDLIVGSKIDERVEATIDQFNDEHCVSRRADHLIMLASLWDANHRPLVAGRIVLELYKRNQVAVANQFLHRWAVMLNNQKPQFAFDEV